MLRLYTCWVLSYVFSAASGYQAPAPGLDSIEAFLQKGGAHWSAPKKVRTIFGNVAAASPAPAQTPVIDLGGGLYQAIGAPADGARVLVPTSNTFLVVTSGGNVVIDTSYGAAAAAHREALAGVSNAPTRFVVLTHAHGDHTGGVSLWAEAGTRVIAHRLHAEFVDYTERLSGYFARMNAAQFGGGAAPAPDRRGDPLVKPAGVRPDVQVDGTHTFAVGDTSFEVMHTPGETPDHVTVWVPKLKAAFVGDNYYQSFPNLYTLRGTRPRWALEYVASLDRVPALEPELLLPGHGAAIRGREEVKRRLTQYRDAIQYVHDATVKGMNEGKDIATLMREVRLPAHLDVGETYGKLSWSVRGIYEGYVGWFDGNVSTMFGPAGQAYPALATLAGGPEAVAARALAIATSEPAVALYLTDVALSVDARHRDALEARVAALTALLEASGNRNERGWLGAALRDAERRLKE